MAGLLDFQDPQLMGLLGISAGLMQAGGPSRMPVSVGQGIGVGLNQGMKFAGDASQMRDRSRALDQRDELMHLKNELMMRGQLPQQFAPSSLGKLVEERRKAMETFPLDHPIIKAYDGAIKNASEGQERSPSFQFIQGTEGLVKGDRRSGAITPANLPGDIPVISPANNPALQGQIAGSKESARASAQMGAPANNPNLQRDLAAAKAGGKERAEAQVAAQIDLPRVTDNANNSLQLVDQLLAHPGFKTSVGAGLGGVAKHIPGSQSAGFHALLDQVKGGAFLEAFNSLKGAGQITEIEGKKATDAITRMQAAQSESEFTAAAREYQGILRKGVERAQTKAGVSRAPGVPAGIDPKLWSVMTPEERALWQ